jgi:diguanylate cyclase (GGDEF)-like protein/PAS domain S-box-containing protein
LTTLDDTTFSQFLDEVAGSDENYKLTLFVSGASDMSGRAIADTTLMCDEHLAGRYHLEVVDVHDDPTSLRGDEVLVTPTLVKSFPLPVRKFVGPLTHAAFGGTRASRASRGRSGRPRTFRLPVGSDVKAAPPSRARRGRSGDVTSLELAAGTPDPLPPTDSGSRLTEPEDLLRAISAGEIDAFVVSDDAGEQRVFTLSTADRPYRMFVENMRDGAVTVSSAGLILYANRRFSELLSCTNEAIVGLPLANFVSGEAPIGFDELRGLGGTGTTVEFDLVDANGMVLPVLAGTSTLEIDGEHFSCFTFTDLTEQKAQDLEILRLGQVQADRMSDLQDAQAALTKQATHDTLTGLPNRDLLMSRVDEALLRAAGTGHSIALLFVDLDRFKRINDTQGHASGDAMLRTVAEKLVAVVRPTDTVARIGGDEFVILAPDIQHQDHAEEMANRALSELNRRPESLQKDDRIAASIGISVSVGGRGTAESLLVEADTAMYHAKLLGRGRAEVFDADLGRQIQERSAAQRLLDSALDQRRIVAYYQPIIDLSVGSVCGFEALARIAELDGSILPPAAFMPVAEESGLVVSLGAQMLEMACVEARSWDRDTLVTRPLSIAVNLSARQFESGDLPDLVRRGLDKSGLDAGQLHLELTETTIMDLQSDIVHQLGRIRDLGVHIGLDDFGTGYASLTHLRQLPLTFVKIDQSFVANIETDSEDDQIVSAVVDLATNLGLRSIAEGVETEFQLARLRELGCDQAQGYLFARPLRSDDLLNSIQHPAW